MSENKEADNLKPTENLDPVDGQAQDSGKQDDSQVTASPVQKPSPGDSDSDNEKDVAFVGYSEDDTALVDAKANPEIIETEEEKRHKKITALGKIVRRVSGEARVLKLDTLYTDHRFNDPEEVASLFKEMKEDEKYAEKYKDIVIVKGSKATYLYSEHSMTTNFANIMIRLEDKDVFTTIAETVRFDSKTYPRATNSTAFFDYPYYIPKDQFGDIVKGLGNKPDFKDIHTYTASNGGLYLYSDLYMPPERAANLVEFEIYRSMNP